MNTGTKIRQHLPASLYTWIVSISFGAVLLDILYARAASRNFNPSDVTVIFSNGADFLLLLSAISLLAGLAAVGLTWPRAAARNLLIVSLIVIVIELFTPVFFGTLISRAQASSGLAFGMWIRLVGNGLSSILAFLALWKLNFPE